jgi:predicted DCC family thiol-disulfide oxidoreductase YuxK
LAPSWTGGQYSIYRALLAAGGLAWIAVALIGIGALALALGWKDRWASGVLVGLLLALEILRAAEGMAASDPIPSARFLCLTFLLALHLRVPPQPFLSWDARSRPDPAGDWHLPRRLWHLAWIGLAVAQGAILLAAVQPAQAAEPETNALSLVSVGLRLFVVAAAVHPPLRRAAWSSIVLWQIAWLSAHGWSGSHASLWLLHLLAIDPAWLPPRSWRIPSKTLEIGSAAHARLFYDGGCGLCQRSVRFVLAEERATPEALRLRFAPLESRAFERLRERAGDAREPLPDSIVLELEDGSLATRATAVLEIASRLGGLWRALSIAGRALPRAALDVAYDLVARVRGHVFARPSESCPILPPELRDRFEP